MNKLKRFFLSLINLFSFSNIESINLDHAVSESTMPTAKELAGFVASSSETSAVSLKQENEEVAEARKIKELDLSETRKVATNLRSVTFAGGRASVESQADVPVLNNNFIELVSNDATFDVFKMSEDYVRRMKPETLLELLADTSPELSRALNDFILMCNPGWEVKAISLQTKEQDEAATDYINEVILAKLKDYYKAPEVIFNKYFYSAFLRGSMASEVILDKRGREFVDIAIVDPASLKHKRYKDEKRGLVWGVYQRQNAVDVDLNIPQFAYIPLNPHFKSNKGRPLATPAIFVCFFLIATLQDLRRVIKQQGYPRIDISVNVEKLRSMIPPDKQKNTEVLKELANQVIAEVKEIYSKLKPDDTYIHSEIVTVNRPVGALNAQSLGIIGDLMKALERMATRALKTMPLLMATTDGVSEANANRQWEIHTAGIKSIQHFAEAILESHFDISLRAAGFQAKTEFRFAELRASELLRDAQVELLKTTTAKMQYDNGSISADEMAQKSANKDKADVPEPRAVKVQNFAFGNNNPAGTQPDPGANRSTDTLSALFQQYPVLPVILSGYRVTAQEIANAETLFKDFAPEQAKDLLNAKEYNN